MSTFFRNVDTRYSDPLDLPFEDGRSAIKSLKARAILVDMEQGPVAETMSGPLGELFDQQQFLTDVSGAGNNWAHGHCVYGPKYKDALLTKLQRAAEMCDSLQSFFVLHSIGGGTGSGLGTYILSLLEDHFPEVYRFTTAIFPSEDDDVITSPYNSVLSLRELTEHADCVLPIENEALADICARMPQQQQSANTSTTTNSGGGPSPAIISGSRLNDGIDLRALEHLYKSGKTAPPAATSAAKKKRSAVATAKTMTSTTTTQRQATSAFGEMNNIVARLLTNLTSSMRFEGSLNVDLNEITTNLVPYPKLHFLQASMSPLFTTVDPRQQPRRLTQMFSDAFNRDHQLIRSNPKASVYLACGLLVRGNVEISDINANIQRLQSEVRMIHWNQEGFKVGLCSVPPIGQSSSLLCLSNNCCIRDTFQRMHDRFRKLYVRRAHLHHYTEYMEVDMLAQAFENVKFLNSEYARLEGSASGDDTRYSTCLTRSFYLLFLERDHRRCILSDEELRGSTWKSDTSEYLMWQYPKRGAKLALLAALLVAALAHPQQQVNAFGFGGFGGFGGDGGQVEHAHEHAHEDFYETLGLTMEATDAEIKRAYRKLSLKYHPDKNAGDADAQQKFHTISRAYEVLSDAQKRQVYDLEGLEGLERDEKGGGHAHSPFDSFFGGGGGKQRGPDAAVDLRVTLEELYNGAKKEARFTRNVVCRKCRGTGAKDGKTTPCQTCGGQGVVLVNQRMGPGFTVQMQQPCPKCGGKGKVFRHHCPHCHGHKVVKQEKVLVAEIERGMPSNHQIVFERESEQRPGMVPGDVIFRLHQVPHTRFRRAGDDLHLEMEISLEDALLGYRKSLTHLDNRKVRIANDAITKPFDVRTVEGEGMPHHNFPSQHGNLHVLHHIKFPTKLSAAEKELVAELLD